MFYNPKPEKLWFSHSKTTFLTKLYCSNLIQKIVEKSFQNPPKTPPNLEKSSKNPKIFLKKTNMSEDNPKMRKKLEKIAQHGPKSPPKGRGTFRRRPALALSGP